jgi:hypothetical protein
MIKLRAGFNIEGFDHILNFKRQIFVKSDNFQNKPTSIVINHDDIVYRNYDMVTCFHCKLKGHISNQCSNLIATSDETPIILSPDKNINET